MIENKTFLDSTDAQLTDKYAPEGNPYYNNIVASVLWLHETADLNGLFPGINLHADSLMGIAKNITDAVVESRDPQIRINTGNDRNVQGVQIETNRFGAKTIAAGLILQGFEYHGTITIEDKKQKGVAKTFMNMVKEEPLDH